MQSASIETVVNEISCRILSETTYTFLDPLQQEQRPDLQLWEATGVGVDYHGVRSGHISLWADNNLKKIATSNMLGIEEGWTIEERKQNDALKEILNILCGNLITTIYGSTAVFELGLPVVLDRQQLIADCAKPLVLWFCAETFPILIAATMQPPTVTDDRDGATP
ncbi:MAG: chemotaxis protein CheX [Chitinivibrionales bacterium]|nr:chemotaxis protein CheX [Chitinivibrionales bacterium]